MLTTKATKTDALTALTLALAVKDSLMCHYSYSWGEIEQSNGSVSGCGVLGDAQTDRQT